MKKNAYELSSLKVVLILFFIGFFTFGNTLFYPFVHDDVVFIQENPTIAQWDNLSSIFIPPLPSEDTPSIVNIYYRPLLEIVYKVEYKLFSFNPQGYHAVNVVLHIINGILVFRTALFFMTSRNLALGLAILFLVHPVQSEAVAAIAGISNLLFTLFTLLSVILYLLAVRNSLLRRGLFFYTLSLICFFVALLTKEQSLVLPFLLVLYEVLFIKESKEVAKIRNLRWIGILVVVAGYLVLRKMLLGYGLPFFLEYKEELMLRILAIPRIVLMYLGILIFPVNLHYYRCVDILEPFLWSLVIFLVVVVMLTVLVRSLAHLYLKQLLFAIGWFLLSLLPTLNVIPMIMEYSFVWTAEHFLYFPLFGFLLFVVTIVPYYFRQIFKDKSGPILFIIFLVIGSLGMFLTIRQNTFFRGEIPLFERAVKFQKGIGRLHILLAWAYYFNQEIDKAIREYLTAQNIMTGYMEATKSEVARKFYLRFIKDIHFDLAHCYEAKGEFDRAISEYKNALKIAPYDSNLFNNLGVVYFHLNRIDDAMEHFQKAVFLNPRHVMAMSNLALCYIYQGEKDEAERLLRRAISMDSNFTSAQENLNRLLQSKSQDSPQE